jgi:hypothetical protein
MHNRTDITRVARELEVAENTVYRWINSTSEPRITHLRRLPAAFPEHRAQLIHAIQQTFGTHLDSPPVNREVSKEIYHQVLELAAISQDEETRFWQVSQAIFENALQQLDSDLQGLAISYAKLMPPHIDGIHSLREVTTRGHDPWPNASESKVFLGNTTLAGTSATLQRLQLWSDQDKSRALVDIDEHERSACAVPITRGSFLAGILLVSSTQPDFFKDPLICQAISEYALLMEVALRDRDFQPVSLLRLRPMPSLKWQRQYLMQNYVSRIITYARNYSTPRREAEFLIQHELELEFEEKARTMLEKTQGQV